MRSHDAERYSASDLLLSFFSEQLFASFRRPIRTGNYANNRSPLNHCSADSGKHRLLNDPSTTRQQAASATEQLKRDSREAAGNIKKGAATARTDLTAAAQGVKEGLNDKSSSELNLNDANKAQLMGLPGIDEPRANAIIADRPYRRAHDVVS